MIEDVETKILEEAVELAYLRARYYNTNQKRCW